MNNSVKRFLSLALALLMVFSMVPQITLGAEAATPDTLYLKPNSNWTQAGARFAAYFFGNGEEWVSMTDSNGDDIYEVTVPSGFSKVIFCRMDPSKTANSWDTKWNQTGDLTIPADGKNQYTVKDGTWDKGGGTWSVYTAPAAPVEHTYTVAGVPGLCGNGWDPAYTANDMVKQSNGTYTKVFENVAAGTYEYKVVRNHSWDYSWGNGSGNATVTVAKDGSTVTISYKPGDSAPNATVKAPECKHTAHDTDGNCTDCGVEVGHKYVDGVCTCGAEEPITVPTISTEMLKDVVLVEFKCATEGGRATNLTGAATSLYTLGEVAPNGESYTCPITFALNGMEDDVAAAFDMEHAGYTHTAPDVADEITITATWNDEKWVVEPYTITITCTAKGGEEEPTAVDYYLVGFINGADYNGEDYKFAEGKQTVTFTKDSYIAIKETSGDWYLTAEYCTDTTGTFAKGNSEKMFVPGDTMLVFTLVENGDGTLTLSYEAAKKYTVVFDAGDEASNVPGTLTLFAGDEVVMPNMIPTREGYTFGGWYTDEACENAYVFGSEITGDLRLYAKWTKEAVEPEEPATITVYFRNDWNWPEVRIHYWGSTAMAGTEWPGAVMQLFENETNIYFAEIPADVTGILFNGEKNDNSGTIQKTVDITTGIQDGNGYIIVWDGSDETETDNYDTFTYTPAGGGEGEDTTNAYYLVGYINNADYNGTDYAFADGKLTVTFTADSYVAIKETSGDWYLTAEYCTDTTGTFAKGNSEKMFVPGNTELTFTLTENDDGTLTMSYVQGEGGEEEPGETVPYKATFHFINTLNWGTVNLYTWIGSGTQLTGQWPGTAVSAAGAYNTATVEFEAAEGTDLNFIFNNGSTQTIDLKLPASAFTKNEDGVYTAEKYVSLTTQTNGKYNAAIVDRPEGLVTSPIVGESSVTFNYGDDSATSVSVAGSFNGWSATATPMTKNDEGVWTATVDGLEAGEYQYKFVVNGDTWMLDPMNGNVVTEADGNQNSAFYILSSEKEEDDNTVTINIHYTRADGNYDGWNLWVWGSALDGRRVDFKTTDENGAVVATIVLENAREHQNISFKERLSVEGNDWKEQASSDRTIDLSTIVSGTIDYYIPECKCVYGDDVIRKNKIKSVDLDYDNGVINVTSVQAIPNAEKALKLVKTVDGESVDVGATIEAVGSKYSLSLPEGVELKLSELYQYQVDYYGSPYAIAIDAAYASNKFAKEYTYGGKDLGAVISGNTTTFKVWAPTATAVSVKLYKSGTEGTEDLINTVEMSGGTVADKGVWTATVDENLNGTYYTYLVHVDGEDVEAVDPYARTTGVNGNRGMVINLDSTDPAGWGSDKNPNKVTSQTDAIIYELHVRDFSIDDSSGMTNKGKYLAFTENGTTVPGTSITTGVDYLEDLGITHLHLLPVYDYGSVDETTSNKFNWGYDPKNYNVPEGSYSTDPYNGAKRVNEFKQMVKSLHDHDISVVMDVVYNHVYDASTFSFNNIVPGYFSRVNSNASGCGNDTASEREMVRKYIVESVLYWHQEYHIDGFRFDLVGLLDVETINEIVKTVHACCPDVIFYGEGWDMDGTNREPGTAMAKQGNASKTPGFAYFSDSIRNGIAGSNGSSTGFVSGAGNGASMATEWMAKPWWTSNPEQVIQYASCHDNYTLIDKLVLSTKSGTINDSIIKMNNLAAAFYMTSQGVPFIHAGEEFLREKLYANGEREENSYNKGDEVNHIEWSNLTDADYAANSEYYKGLIAFRQAHPALRYSTATQVKNNVQTYSASGNLIVMRVDGNGAGDKDIFVIFNANKGAQTVNLPEGEWTININGEQAGTASLGTASGSVSVAGISAMVLTKDDEGPDEKAPVGPSEAKTVYFSNNKGWNTVYAYAWTGETYHLGAWPGVAMTYVETNDYGEKIFSVELPASEDGIEGLIFHNNDGVKTVDIVPGADGTGYYCTDPDAEGKFAVGTYVYRAPIIGSADDYYLAGWINGADYTGTDYKFSADGTVTATFSAESYVYVVNGDNSEVYMTDGYQGAVTSATLKDTAKHTLTADKWDKLLIPGGEEVVITMVKNDDNTITLSYKAASSSAFEDKSGVQNGVTLHAWNWSFDEITKNMATIAEQGYTAIQTSPIQPLKEATNLETNSVGSHWWVYYQPVDFVITTDSGNALGTKTDFVEMCAEAEKYGIKVIVDVVANHLANATGNDLSDAIAEEIRNNKDYWHDITTDITNWNDRFDMTQHCMSGLPDLNTANDDIQQMVLDFLKECVNAGADGFRFDAAKSIETPKDGEFASDFWPTVVGGIQEYAGGDLYIYGEILDDAKIAISAYTEYMSVTDNGWGNHMRTLVNSGTAGLISGFYKSAAASNLVIWAESHDTYADGSSSGVSDANINKTWALVAARKDAMGLYFARPESLKQALGVASVTGWANEEVKAVNEFHNEFVGQAESISNENGVAYVERGTTGAVLVNVSAASGQISVTAKAMADGTYEDRITGNTFTVADGKITGEIGATGIAVVMEVEEPSAAAKIGDTEYESLSAALADAAEGATIELVSDVKEKDILLIKGVTLDLSGHTVEAENFAAVNGTQVKNTKTTGYLKVPHDGISLQATNTYVPVWNEEDGYYLVEWGYSVATQVSADKATTTYYFLPKPRNAGVVNNNVVELLQNGAVENDLQITVRLAWSLADGEMSQNFYYNEDMIGSVFTNNSGMSNNGMVFVLKVTGYENFENVTMQAVSVYGDWNEQEQFIGQIEDAAKLVQVK